MNECMRIHAQVISKLSDQSDSNSYYKVLHSKESKTYENVVLPPTTSERMNETDLNDSIPCQPWSNRLSKMAQPNLNFIAPETQLNSKCSLLSDMFSLGLVICAVFNRGRPLIQAANTTSNYIKQLEMNPIQISLFASHIEIFQNDKSAIPFHRPRHFMNETNMMHMPEAVEVSHNQT
uniref:Protein kinase domain-containing protein n=1 Tax=Glossina austeni TaxID=7395 RepID=A0A1A9URR7_GLOAU